MARILPTVRFLVLFHLLKLCYARQGFFKTMLVRYRLDNLVTENEADFLFCVQTFPPMPPT
jgi:hypothetical protein